MTDSKFDCSGKPWALVSEVKEGDTLIADGGFSDPTEENEDHLCIKEGVELVVKFDKELFDNPPKWYGYKPSIQDSLYVECSHGKHYLDGQIDTDKNDGIEFYTGFYLKGK